MGQDTVYAVAVNSPPPVTTPGPGTSPVPTKAPVQTPAATGSRPLPPARLSLAVGTALPPGPTATPDATPTVTAPGLRPPRSPPRPKRAEEPASPPAAASPEPASPSPAVSAPPPSPSPEATPPTPSPQPTEPPATVEPATPPPTLPPPTPAPTAATVVAIAEKVVLVGSPPAYSPDGSWVAFSARPDDGSHGPDVYAWHVGDAKARAVTDDHASVFSGGSPARSSPARPGRRSQPTRRGRRPPLSPTPTAAVVARSFIVDPATRDVTDIGRDGVRRPVVDPTSRLVVFWAGTLAWDAAALAWLPADGRLVAANWQDVLHGAKEPAARALPADAAGSAISDWEVRFDPAGRRLARAGRRPGDAGDGQAPPWWQWRTTARSEPCSSATRRPCRASPSTSTGSPGYLAGPERPGEPGGRLRLARGRRRQAVQHARPRNEPVVVVH